MKKILIIILSLLVCSCSKVKDIGISEEKNYDINLGENTFNVYDKVTIKSLINDKNIELLNENDLIDTKNIGENNIIIKYKHGNKTYKKDINYMVIDGVAPILINVPSTQTIILNSNYNPCDKAVFVDNYDKKPTCDIEGEYDLSKVGNYDLKYIIKDSSNNTISKKLNLIVKEQTSTTVSTAKPSTPAVRKRYNFNDAIANFKNDNTLIGIDVSRYQGDIDYEKVKNAGCEFVMMRIGVQSGFKKELSIDSYYLKNIENAKKAGLKVGIYLYSTAVNDKIAKEQAEWVIKTLNGTKLDFPIAFDWENWQYIREYEISLYDLSSAYLTFANYIEEHGYKAMLYGSKYYLENMWMDKGNYPVWLAHYTEKTNYSSDYIMWQFSQIGEIDGINSDVDLNVYYIK